MAGDVVQVQAAPTTRYTVWDRHGAVWSVEWPGPFQGSDVDALGRVTAAEAGEVFPGDVEPIDLPADVGMTRRAKVRHKRASSAAAHRVDPEDRAAAGGGAEAGALAAAAE